MKDDRCRACPRNNARLLEWSFVAKKSGIFQGKNTSSVKKILKNVNTRTQKISQK